MGKIHLSQIFVDEREIVAGLVTGESRINTGEVSLGRGFQDRPVAAYCVFESAEAVFEHRLPEQQFLVLCEQRSCTLANGEGLVKPLLLRKDTHEQRIRFPDMGFFALGDI